MRFRDFIQENTEKHAVLAFGRMNPPTTGHEVLVNKVKDVANKVGGSHHVVLSHSQDAGKNPLTAAQKVKHAKRFFPDTNITTSDKESPTFLQHAAKLHQQGVTHLHMVAGSDRVPEFKKKLAQYNGTHPGALYNFKKITVHSAGARDPDAEGTEGMSASKMRSHATTKNFDEFRKGIPGHVSHAHAKELFHDVRKGMNLKEDLNESFEMLFEGVHDQGIFKAVFLAGGPGSGKDYVLNNTLDGQGLVEINSDKALEFLMDKKGLDKMMPADEEDKRNEVRGQAKNMTEIRQRLALLGRNGLIINGTGDDVSKVMSIKSKLEELGYDTAMLMVNTRDDISAQRNIERGQRGGRAVPELVRKEKWDNVQNARTEYAKLFGANYKEFDNSEDLRNAEPDVVKAKKAELLSLHNDFKEFVSTPPSSEESQFWVAHELDKKDTLAVPKDGVEQLPPSGDDKNNEAARLGLQYYGFGRYGKNGKVTHRSVHGKLVEIPKEEPKQPTIAVNSSSGTDIKKPLKESVMHGYQFTDSSEVLTLGSRFEVVGDKLDVVTFENADVITEKVKLMRDGKGNLRIFMLRSSAAKEAHTKNGTVIKYKTGYVVKLNEGNENDTILKKLVLEQTNLRTKIGPRADSTDSGDTGDSAAATTLTAAGRRQQGVPGQTKIEDGQTSIGKITIDQIRAKQKTQLSKESIDKGIETGLSMASSGENLGRDTTRTKLLKKPLEELTGDETTMSIGDQKEDELKKVGINLKTFKAKKFVG